MDAESSEAKRRNQLLDLDSLDVESLKALVLAKQTEIENLNLLVLKLKRMHFGQRPEKMNADIGQLELRLEDLETNQAAAEPLPAQLAILAVNARAAKRPARFPPNCRARPKRLRRSRKAVRTAGERCARSVKMSRRFWNK